MKTKVRVSIRLKLFKNQQLIFDTSKQIKDRVLRAAQERMWDLAYLRVIYDKHYNFYNDGSYTNFDDLKFALSSFTEQSLIKYARGEDE